MRAQRGNGRIFHGKNAFLSVGIMAMLLSAGIGSNIVGSGANVLGAYLSPLILQINAALFTGGLLTWYGIAVLGALVVILVSAFVYMLSTFLDSPKARQWARTQVFQALVGILFAAIFLFLYTILLINPQAPLGAAGLVPSTCTVANTTMASLPPATNFFSLSACDLNTFLGVSFGYFQLLWYLSYFGGFSPGIGLKVSIPPTVPGQGFDTKVESFYPRSFEELTSIGFSALIFVLMLNEVQMLLIAGAPLFLALLVGIGIIAWIFTFSRSFGGAMIAFGIGMGIIYPLLVLITYGFISTSLLTGLSCLVTSGCNQFSPIPIVGKVATITVGTADIASILVTLVGTLFYAFITGTYPPQLAALALQYGYVFAGLTFIPFLNFLIVDAFIVDFSKVMGERVSFIGILGNLI